ncbi:uncharacterized protein LOC119387148 [Rhipicephalus sanguineus]|uniref:uncharacterized protein LOC119387148 n=1 Tax=Rhipicephalus sanguineus TaxID=34632 RepID=UPI001894E47C|nr:uncharacterized protein LOC119387148 [Rhipicephalus sanguineus]
MLSSCGFDFLLGIGMPAQLLWDVFPTVCMGIRLCYARHEEKNADLAYFRDGVAECIGRGLSFAKGIRPDLFSHVTSELIPHAQECMRTTLPSDVRVALAMMRYARNIMLRGRTG